MTAREIDARHAALAGLTDEGWRLLGELVQTGAWALDLSVGVTAEEGDRREHIALVLERLGWVQNAYNELWSPTLAGEAAWARRAHKL